MKLNEISIEGELPMVLQLALERVKAGEKVELNFTEPSGQHHEGLLHTAKMGSPMTVPDGKGGKMDVPRTFIVSHVPDENGSMWTKREWFRADTFDNRYDLKKVGDHWEIVNREKLKEGLEENKSLLVDLIQQQLDKGKNIYLAVKLPETPTFAHKGHVTFIDILETPSSLRKRLGDYSVEIHFTSDDKGLRSKILSRPLNTFDDHFTLKKSGDHFLLVSVEDVK